MARKFFQLENIVCIAGDGKPFESYKKVLIAKDFEKDKTGKKMKFTPYQAICYFEQQGDGLFLPSFALTCNILGRLYEIAVKKKKFGMYKVINQESKEILDQYNHEEHIQNTIVAWGDQIIHYPKDSDFVRRDGGIDGINKNKKPIRRLSFNAQGLRHATIEEALKYRGFFDRDRKNKSGPTQYQWFIKNLTGLKNPEILVEIGEYFHKPACIPILIPLTHARTGTSIGPNILHNVEWELNTRAFCWENGYIARGVGIE